MERERLVVVGAGMAGLKLLEELKSRCPGRYNVTVVGAEPEPAYNRVLLSSLLAGEASDEDLALKERAWYGANGYRLFTGAEARAIDRAGKRVTLRDGRVLAYDKLVLATGSEPIRLPLPGGHLPQVLTFRDRCDAMKMTALATPGARAVVIGGGLLGLEAAYGLVKLGCAVTVVHLADKLMERQLDAAGAATLKRALEAKGIAFALGAQSETILGETRVEGLRLATGEVLPADMIIMACGVRPNAVLGRAAELEAKRGILVDDAMRASDPDVFAIGECAEHRGVVYGLVAPAYEHARTLAAHLAGEAEIYEGSLLSTNLKVSGVSVFSAGLVEAEEGCETVLLADPGHGHYRKFLVREDRLVGAILVGEASDALWYLDLIAKGEALGAMRDDLAFGRSFAMAA
ncbi:NAD(P)/FAD-dependent oxidoreductase [Chenggangzhangella methanolivorans]|uniref:FAD-dependent oxidoreductase n=1 Tax=Chenggangzhangella methanolivorans TaxID=1437009 RepID=A0A9E6UL98_9HYPH|nr:FAD-dependent oxidoreductase [Chenggangzhangella methanolivorans]QZN98695.1 FAD-dependent oxidoreductase [Chenggangzhangella methanolivorans]